MKLRAPIGHLRLTDKQEILFQDARRISIPVTDMSLIGGRIRSRLNIPKTGKDLNLSGLSVFETLKDCFTTTAEYRNYGLVKKWPRHDKNVAHGLHNIGWGLQERWKTASLRENPLFIAVLSITFQHGKKRILNLKRRGYVAVHEIFNGSGQCSCKGASQLY